MSDSTTLIPQVSQSAIQREATVNANFDEASPAMLFGRLATTTALTWAYQGGRHNGTQFANGTVALTASNTNYVVAHKTTLAVTASTSITNWNDTTTYGRCYLVVAGSSTITSYEDHRSGTNGILSGVAGSSGAVPTGTGFRHVTSGAEDGAAVAVDLSSAHATGILAAARFPALTGDVTTSSGVVATTIATNAVTNAKAAQMVAHTIKGNNTGSTANSIDLTLAQVAAELMSLVGMVVQSPAYAGTLTIDLTGVTAAIVVVNVGTLTGPITFNITNGTDGQVIRVRFTQDGTGSRIFTAGAALRFSTDTPSPTLTTTASKMDRLAFEWHAGAGKADLIAVNKGY